MKFLISSLFVLLAAQASAQTSFAGGIYANTSWTHANSPYTITGDVVVFDGVTLTIEPGVEVKMNNGVKMEIRGRMVVAGTATDSVYIHGNTSTPSPIFWKGIVFLGTSQSSTGSFQADFRYCNISDASTVFDFDLAYRGPYQFRNCNFSYNLDMNNDGGLGGMLFDNCIFSHNRYGMKSFQFGGRISNCIFDYNEYGVQFSDTIINCKFRHNTNIALQPYGYTSNCEITDNNIGVQCSFNSTDNVFINNKIKNNTLGMKLLSWFSNTTVTGNEICDNTQYNLYLDNASNANLANNCWCATTDAAIRSKIYDGYVDISKGLVNFTPYYTNCTNFPTAIATTAGAQNDYTIVPNPKQPGQPINILGSFAPQTTITICNTLGQPIPFASQRLGDNKMQLTLDAPAGIYLVSITNTSTGSRTTKQLVVQ